MSSVPATDGPLGLFNYPAEIRTKIYRYLFVIDTPTPFNFQGSSQFFLAAKLIYEEGRVVLYGENRFTFGDRKFRGDGPTTGREIFPVIKKRNILLIRHIQIRGWPWGIDAINKTRVAEVNRMKHLQTIELRAIVYRVERPVTKTAYVEAAQQYLARSKGNSSLPVLLENARLKVSFQALMPGPKEKEMVVFFELKLCDETKVIAQYVKQREHRGGMNYQLRWGHGGA